MPKQLLKLVIFVALFMGSPAYADPACDNDTTPDPDVARDKDVWLNGYCKSFLPCRLVYEQFQGCQAANNFLSNLGAKEGMPLTESQVEEALVRTKSIASASTPKMAKISALSERDRIVTLDSSTVAALQSGCAEQACLNYREKQLNLLTSEVEKLNGNSDILYWVPEYAPVQAFDVAERLGWTRQGGQWVFSGGKEKESVTTLGQYLLSVPECQKLHDRLDQELKWSPSKEPDNLSFFEGECVPQVASYGEDVKSWRAALLASKHLEQQAVAGAQQTGSQPETTNQDSGLVDTTYPMAEDKSGAMQTEAANTALSVWNEDVVASAEQVRRQLQQQKLLNDANQSRKPVASPALDQLIKKIHTSGR